MRAVERFGLDPRQRRARAYLYVQILRLELDPCKRWRIGRLDDQRQLVSVEQQRLDQAAAGHARGLFDRGDARGDAEASKRAVGGVRGGEIERAFARTIAADREMRRGKQRREAGVMATNGTTNEERVGFIGLGIMGRPMVANLIGAGIVPTVWNRSQGRGRRVHRAGRGGGRVAASGGRGVGRPRDDRD